MPGQILNSNWVGLLVWFLLAIATYVSLTTVQRFISVESQLLTDSSFDPGLAHWHEQGAGSVSVEDGSIVISNVVSGTHAVSQTIPIKAAGFYRLSFEFSVTDLKAGPDLLAGAAVFLIYNKKDGARKPGAPNLLSSGDATEKGRHFDVHIRPNVESVDLVLRVFKASGKLTIANLKFSRIEETAFFVQLKKSWSLGWVGIGIAILAGAAQVLRPLELISVSVLCAIALTGALMPEAALNLISEFISSLSSRVFPAVVVESQFSTSDSSRVLNAHRSLSDFGHLVIFIGLGVFAGMKARELGSLFAATSATVFAITTEVLQLFVLRRTPSIWDLAIDLLGLLSGMFAAYIFFFACRRFLTKKPKRNI